MVDEVPLTTAVEDTSSHTLVDDLPLTELTLPPSTPLSALELETKKMVYSFNDTGELPDTIQEQDSQPDNVPPLVSESLQVVELLTLLIIFQCVVGFCCKCCPRI